MQVLVIPDIHLKPYIFRLADRLLEQGAAEQAVCLMDIPDDWNQEYNIDLYEGTYDAAIAFAKKYPDTLWCYGNHDLSYRWNERESGYSTMAAWTVNKRMTELQQCLPETNEIRYVQKIDNVVFCHGGIADIFVREIIPTVWQDEIDYEDVDQVIDVINQLHCDSMWNDWSPIWFRPQYSSEPVYKEKETMSVS